MSANCLLTNQSRTRNKSHNRANSTGMVASLELILSCMLVLGHEKVSHVCSHHTTTTLEASVSSARRAHRPNRSFIRSNESIMQTSTLSESRLVGSQLLEPHQVLSTHRRGQCRGKVTKHLPLPHRQAQAKQKAQSVCICKLNLVDGWHGMSTHLHRHTVSKCTDLPR